MSGKGISSSKKPSTTDSRRRHDSRHSHKKSKSSTSNNTSSSRYIAYLGDKPTKITIKRYARKSHSQHSSSKHKTKSSTSNSDVKHRNIAKKSLSTPAPTAPTEPKSKEPSTNNNVQQADLVRPTSIGKKITKANGDEPLDLATNGAANEKKRAAESEEKNGAKKPRLTTDSQTQTVVVKPPVAAPVNPRKAHPSKHQIASSIMSFSYKSANALHQMQQYNNKFKEHVVSLPPTLISPAMVTAIPPIPPNWINNYEETIMSLLTFKKYDINRSTKEYQTVEDMLHPLEVIRVEQIVNPDLWKRFVNNRKEMLRSKTDDLNILSELGLDERDVMRCTHLVLNQATDPLRPPYSDNMAMLFHCTKSETSLNSILSQGLDERLSNVFGGRLGKGIYFADDPQKALQYDGTGRILIFAVLLGDCISVDHYPFKNALVREPEKHEKEMRNLKDLFYDSIVGRPAGYNEYVIYNRHQCCPLYEVEFKRPVSETVPVNATYAVKNLPPFAWLPDDPNCPAPKVCESWPFMANELFKKMESQPMQPDEYVYSEISPLTDTSADQMVMDKKLATLVTFGFNDAVRNIEILSKFNNDLYLTLNYLLDENVQNIMTSTQPVSSVVASSPNDQLMPLVGITDIVPMSNSQTSSSAANQLPSEVADFLLEFESTKPVPTDLMQPEMVECTICYNEYKSFNSAPELWKELKCGHRLCGECHSRIQTTRTTMAGVEHTFLKCPFCHDTAGIQIGTCPDIQMNVTTIPHSCKGYEDADTISINYFVDAAYRLNRTAYLPNNDEGREVLKLLKIAYDRRLSFAIGESATTGRKNVLIWVIHHKTSMCDGMYGYPDPEYMSRVKSELKSFGIQ
ncbi:uncharacterized protein LOC119066711 isoform X2 [Bradysia coprophila]|uniref:uncharacterized protein LOC119066711 isoform X2 n=1 Tax=Bradysia coprophila TaxID=38358 RepID=UPI00187DC6B0|nr:uncharacterized protein LOC119066711 isoform X2 [Bradysia coprophila]